ncbi:MAG: phosphohistidine phosphatase SixA [Elusimicrobiota bacterium]
MRIYLMRHGHALSCAESGVRSDMERPLSELGVQESRESAQRLLRRGAKPQLALCSPLMRAQSTAQEVASVLGLPQPRVYKPLENILPGSALVDLFLKERWDASELLLVGHMPQVAEASARLSGCPLHFMTAAVAAFESGDKGAPWRMLWQTSPVDPE